MKDILLAALSGNFYKEKYETKYLRTRGCSS